MDRNLLIKVYCEHDTKHGSPISLKMIHNLWNQLQQTFKYEQLIEMLIVIYTKHKSTSTFNFRVTYCSTHYLNPSFN